LTLIISFVLMAALSPDLASQLDQSSTEETSSYTLEDYNKDFVNACATESGKSAFCSCAADYLTNNYTLEQLAAMDFDSSYTPSEMSAATKNCEHLL